MFDPSCPLARRKKGPEPTSPLPMAVRAAVSAPEFPVGLSESQPATRPTAASIANTVNLWSRRSMSRDLGVRANADRREPGDRPFETAHSLTDCAADEHGRSARPAPTNTGAGPRPEVGRASALPHREPPARDPLPRGFSRRPSTLLPPGDSRALGAPLPTRWRQCEPEDSESRCRGVHTSGIAF